MKPAALDRFIQDLSDNDSRPPPTWRPRDLLQDETGLPNIDGDLSPHEMEVQELLLSLRLMFPLALDLYLEEKAKEVAGRPTDSDEFVKELLRSDQRTPVDWTPKVGKYF